MIDPIVIKLFEVVWLREIALSAASIGINVLLDVTIGLLGFGVLVAMAMVISGFPK